MKNTILSSLTLSALCLSCSAFSQTQPSSRSLAGIQVGAPWSKEGVSKVACQSAGQLPLLKAPDEFCTFKFDRAPKLEGKPVLQNAAVLLRQGEVLSVTIRVPLLNAERDRLEPWLKAVAQRAGLEISHGEGEVLMLDKTVHSAKANRAEKKLSRVIYVKADVNKEQLELTEASFEIALAVSELSRP